jgi:DNA-directed RNA polymerase subunit RPC12/RpoP
MEYKCPACGEQFDASALQQPAGIGGGQYCPACQQRVSLSMPYGLPVALVSLLISVGALALLHVRNIFGFLVGTVLIWIPLSMFLNLWSTRLKPPALKKWKPRRRTFFEWLYERDAPQDLIDKRPRP